MQGRFPDLARLVSSLQGQGPGAAQALADAVRPYAPVKTGALRDDLTGASEALADGVQLQVVAGVPQAAFVIGGTAAHDIVPRTAGTLRFEVSGGEVVFAKRVHHPGTAPNPFGEQAAGAIEAVVSDLVASAVAEVAG